MCLAERQSVTDNSLEGKSDSLIAPLYDNRLIFRLILYDPMFKGEPSRGH